MSLTFRILGCGSSGGVPRIAGGWGLCDPANPRNRRLRCSALIERIGPEGTTRVLIDTSPDMREQLLAASISTVDAVVYTHDHADHTHGIDDLRAIFIAERRRIPCHADARTLQVLTTRFGYCFESPHGSEYPPTLSIEPIEPSSTLTISGKGGVVALRSLELQHGAMGALGFRIGGLAYTPDVSAIPDEAAAQLDDLDVWVIDALRDAPHPSHFSVAEALAWIDRKKPRRAILTNLHTDLDYHALEQRLPRGVAPAYDGMVVSFDA
jgi:phosphoribosyl 1,2-cyclic phosphate phosphodiesterase